MVAFDFTNTTARTCRRLPNKTVIFKRTPYSSTREDSAGNRQFQYTFQPQYTRYNQTNSPVGSSGMITRWETWLYLPTVERKVFSFLPANTGTTGANSIPIWWKDFLRKFFFIDPGAGANATTLALISLFAPKNLATVSVGLTPGPATPLTTPLTVLPAFETVAIGWVGGSFVYFGIARLTQVGTNDFFYASGASPPVVCTDKVITPSGFSIWYNIPEMRPGNALRNFLWAQRSVGELRPRVYDLTYPISSASDITGSGYHIVVDDVTLDGLLNTTGILQNSNPTLCPGNEGCLLSINGTFEDQTPRFLIWISCDGMYWRLIRWVGADTTSTTILNEGGGGLWHQDPDGNYFFISAGASILLPLIGMASPSTLLPTFPPLTYPALRTLTAFKGGAK